MRTTRKRPVLSTVPCRLAEAGSSTRLDPYNQQHEVTTTTTTTKDENEGENRQHVILANNKALEGKRFSRCAELEAKGEANGF